MKSLERHEIVKGVVEMLWLASIIDNYIKLNCAGNCWEFQVDFKLQFEVLPTNFNVILGKDTKGKNPQLFTY